MIEKFIKILNKMFVILQLSLKIKLVNLMNMIYLMVKLREFMKNILKLLKFYLFLIYMKKR